jgi:hypothetical protein
MPKMCIVSPKSFIEKLFLNEDLTTSIIGVLVDSALVWLDMAGGLALDLCRFSEKIRFLVVV